MPFKILLVDDEIDQEGYLIAQLKQLLKDDDFDVQTTADGESAYDLIFAFKPDVIVLDIKFGSQPRLGLEICESIRANGVQTPIILITKIYTETEDVLEGFKRGADDYVRLPCDKKEIRARILANLPPEFVTTYSDYIRIDYQSQRVCLKRNEEWHEVILTPLQFRLLRELALNEGVPMKSVTLMDRVWDKEEMDERALATAINRLRAVIEPDKHKPVYIETIHGVGYRFNGRSTRAYKGSAKRRAPC